MYWVSHKPISNGRNNITAVRYIKDLICLKVYTVTRTLLVLTLIFFTTTSLAQTKVNIEIKGIEKELEDNVRLFLSIEQQKDHTLMSEARLHRLHKKATQEITNALQPYGYYRPLVKTELTQATPNQWQAIYTIDSGPPIPISESNIIINDEMRSDPAFEKIIRNNAFPKGQTFNHIEYETYKTNLAQLAAESGYFNARFSEHRVDIDLDNYEARIYLKYDGGTRYFFGEVSINQDVLDDELLQRYIPFTQGTPYSLNSLIDLQQALNDSYYFQVVEVSPGKPLHANSEIPIKVNLTPRKRHRFSFGVGYGTDTGARAKFGWEMPRINKSGHRFDTEASVSEIGYSLISRYRVPVLNPRTDQLIYRAGIVNETTDTSESTLRSLGVSLKHSRNEWRETISLNYQQEDFIVGDDSGVSILLIPGINWSRTWGEDFIYAVDGVRFDLDLRGANQSFISDNDFAQLLPT